MSIHPSLLNDLIEALEDVEPLKIGDLPDTRLDFACLEWIEPLLPTKKEKD